MNFDYKKDFHKKQAQLPFEEKMRIMIELQKIDLEMRPKKDANDRRCVWTIK